MSAWTYMMCCFISKFGAKRYTDVPIYQLNALHLHECWNILLPVSATDPPLFLSCREYISCHQSKTRLCQQHNLRNIDTGIFLEMFAMVFMFLIMKNAVQLLMLKRRCTSFTGFQLLNVILNNYSRASKLGTVSYHWLLRALVAFYVSHC